MDIGALDDQVWMASEMVGILPHRWEKFCAITGQLAAHNEAMYAHSMRVGLYAMGLKANESLNTMERFTPEAHDRWLQGLRLPLLGGCGHDVGKCWVPNEILNKQGALTTDEYDIIETHPLHSWMMLHKEFPLTALVAGLHHSYSPRHYGINLDECKPEWIREELSEEVIETAKLVMICDFFDALTTRSDAAGFLKGAPEGEYWWRVGKTMLEYFPYDKSRVMWLLANLI